MTVRLLHAADIHLGYRQYDSDERYDDFARAFVGLVDDALRLRVDGVLLAGDLFHQRTLEPRTLLQATTCLGRLREARIPVLAIEGNHERAFALEGFSWPDYLADSGSLTLLKAALVGDTVPLTPCEGNVGAYYDLPGGVRVIGLRYYGGSTSLAVRALPQALAEMPGPRPAYTVLMLHAGLEGILDLQAAMLTRAELEPLRPHVDYVAFGHIHKPYIQDDWLYNPGSLETNSVAEVEWPERGYLLVEVEPGRSPAHRVTAIRNRRRAFERLSFDVTPWESPEALLAALETYLGREATPQRVERRPVVELQLTGTLTFDAMSLDWARVEQLVEASFRPIKLLFRKSFAGTDFEIRPEEDLSREQLEQRVLRELVERDVRHRAHSEEWVSMLLSLKQLALEGSSPDTVVAELRAFRARWPQEEMC